MLTNVTDSTITTVSELVYTTKRDIWLLNYEIVRDIRTASLVFVCAIVSLFGIVANVINMVIFRRLGFQETINISLFALSLSDFFSLIPLLWTSVCFNPIFLYTSKVPIYFIGIEHYTGGYPHTIFTRVSGFITVFITLERCLCIAFPLKIKQVMTRTRVTSIIVAIYVIVIGSLCQNFFTFELKWYWSRYRNRSMFGAIYFDNYRNIEVVTQTIQTVYIVFSFSIVVICTTVFVWKLNQRGKWRQSASSAKEKDTTSSRDQQVIKMVVCVAAVFIASFIPVLLISIAFRISPDIDIGMKYHNLCMLLFSICYPIEALNSSVNIFVYYKMMSKYRAAFSSFFHRNAKT